MSSLDSENTISIQHTVAPPKEIGLISRVWKLISNPRRLWNAVRRHIFGLPGKIDWDLRVSELGAYSVIDSRHPQEDYEYVTKRQKELIFPHFVSSLNGTEKNLLDFGCGAGRFTADLSRIIGGEAVGTDSTKSLIDICRSENSVRFIHSDNYFDESSTKFDVIWVCLVLGGLTDDELGVLASKMEKSLVINGLIFLVESTGEFFQDGVWRVRTKEQITAPFKLTQFKRLGFYYDVGQEISILAGRKTLE